MALSFHDGDPGAEGVEDTGEFAADYTTSEDGDGLRDMAEGKHVSTGEDGPAVERKGGDAERAAACCQDKPVPVEVVYLPPLIRDLQKIFPLNIPRSGNILDRMIFQEA